LAGKSYTPIITGEYRWEKWATPKDKDGKLDHHKAMTGDDLIDFVNVKLFPYLKKFKTTADHADTIEYKIGEIFSELKNRIQSGYNLREVINLVDELRFRSSKEKHELSALYEDKIKNMGNAGRNGGEYYTPRPLEKIIVKVIAPQIGETVYDGAGGSMGFLVEAFEFMKAQPGIGTREAKILQEKTFYGKEKKSLAYIIGIMNMICMALKRRTFCIPTRWRRIFLIFRREIVTTWCWRTRLSAARNAPRCSRISRSKRARRRFCFCSTSLRS
jgi:type I restriction enzyme M protein